MEENLKVPDAACAPEAIEVAGPITVEAKRRTKSTSKVKSEANSKSEAKPKTTTRAATKVDTKARPKRSRKSARPAELGALADFPDWPAPRTPEELHAWLTANLNLRVPQRALIEGHTAAFDYLVHAFFDGRFVRRENAPAEASSDSVASAWVETQTPCADCVVWAARGGGKTFLGAVATLLDMIFKPGIEIRVLGGSMEQSRRMHAHLRRLLDGRRTPALAGLVKAPITEKRIRFHNGSEVELLAQSQASVRGTRVQKLRCDEVELFDREVWEAAQLVTRSRTIERADGTKVEVAGAIECLSTMHVPHGLMSSLVQEAREGKRRLFRWGVVDVLAECGPKHECASCALKPECGGRAKERDAAGEAPGHLSIKDAVSMKGRVSQLTWSAEMLCLATRRSDCVLPEFDPAVHVISHEIDVPGVAIVAGMDFGYRAPTAILWAAHDLQGDLWIMDERIESGKLLEEHIQAIREGTGKRANHQWPSPKWLGVDPAGRNKNEQTGMSHIQFLQRAGLEVKQKRLGVHEGLELVRARLKPAGDAKPRLYVHVRCAVLRECLEKYHYPSDRPYSMEPVKDGFDHAVDALRYLVQNLDKPVKTVKRMWADMRT